MRYAVIKSVEVYNGDDKIGTVIYEDSLSYKAKLEDLFMTAEDICYIGKMQEWLDEHGDIVIEEQQ